MSPLCLFEGQRIEEGDDDQPQPVILVEGAHRLDRRLFRRLELHDRRRRKGDRVFDWDHNHAFRARNRVGVVQVPGLSVEILPKTMEGGMDFAAAVARARANLLVMLHHAGELPSTAADIADLSTAEAPLFEALVRLFARHLTGELRRGVPHEYQDRIEDLGVLRGRLLVGEQVRYNAFHAERFRVAHDEFTADATVGRVLRRTVSLLLRGPRQPGSQRALRDALYLLDGIWDVAMTPADVDRLPRSRELLRFGPLLAFCRMVLAGESPAFETGGEPCFSLLFPMERLYQDFLAGFIRRYVMNSPTMEGTTFHVEGAGFRRPLVERVGDDGKRRGVLALKPDFLFRRASANGEQFAVLDAKWKQPDANAARADLYQMFGYAQRYKASCTLVYPRFPTGADFPDEDEAGEPSDGEAAELAGDVGRERDYLVQVGAGERTIRTRFIHLGRDLARDRDGLLADLAGLIEAAFGS